MCLDYCLDEAQAKAEPSFGAARVAAEQPIPDARELVGGNSRTRAAARQRSINQGEHGARGRKIKLLARELVRKKMGFIRQGLSAIGVRRSRRCLRLPHVSIDLVDHALLCWRKLAARYPLQVRIGRSQ